HARLKIVIDYYIYSSHDVPQYSHRPQTSAGSGSSMANGGGTMTNVRARKIPADERRNVTVEAVIDLAGKTNPGDITTAAIAKHMKLTQGAIFRHFPNKDAIW